MSDDQEDCQPIAPDVRDTRIVAPSREKPLPKSRRQKRGRKTAVVSADKPAKKARGKRRREDIEIDDVALGDFINAEHLPETDGRRGCREKVRADYYGLEHIRESSL